MKNFSIESADNDHTVLIMNNNHVVKVVEDILNERDRQAKLSHGGNTDDFDKSNSMNDWIAYCNAYLGRAADKCFRNQRENQNFRENMVKVGALVFAAIESYDRGYLNGTPSN